MINFKKSVRLLLIAGLFACLPLIQGCKSLTDSSSRDETFLSDAQPNGIIVPADDSQLNSKQRTLYRQDAEILALRYTNNKDSTQTEIPESLIRSLYNGLIHIVISHQPEVAEFTEAHSVHVRDGVAAREILVFTDSAATWLDAWQHGKTKTGNAQVDHLTSRFGFTLADYSKIDHVLPTTIATLRSSRPLNTYAASRLFEQLHDVNHAEPNINFGDGSDIRMLFFDDHLRFTFDLGFGDCPSGCINRHLWKYNVYHDGSVKFIKEEGASLPD